MTCLSLITIEGPTSYTPSQIALNDNVKVSKVCGCYLSWRCEIWAHDLFEIGVAFHANLIGLLPQKMKICSSDCRNFLLEETWFDLLLESLTNLMGNKQYSGGSIFV
ncbi:hypothetical protein MKX01_003286 [Papaver californicum]|nr:hypothetical protein MKX01_003286 [Papaver californicum]